MERDRPESERYLADYVRRGTTPFFGLPVVDAADPEALKGRRIVFLGIPYDGGSSQGGGARYAPYSVRRASIFALGEAPVPWIVGGEAVDGGNLVAPMRDPGGMREVVEQGIAGLL